jgi:protein-disulfide isomerase
MLKKLAVLLALIATIQAAQAQQAWYPIIGQDGTPVANHRVPVELESQIASLPGKVVVGNPHGDVTLVEFYDLNCPYCRAAAADLDDLLHHDHELKLILVPFPVLSVASIAAGRVELAVAGMIDAKRFYQYHQRLYAGRGVVDGARALAEARGFVFDLKQLVAAANADIIAATMTMHVRLGDALGLAATPSFVIKGVAIVGYPGKAALANIIKSVRRCDKVVC